MVCLVPAGITSKAKASPFSSPSGSWNSFFQGSIGNPIMDLRLPSFPPSFLSSLSFSPSFLPSFLPSFRTSPSFFPLFFPFEDR